MKYLYAVSFVHQDSQNHATLQSTTIMLEGLGHWDEEQVKQNARLEMKAQGVEIKKGFREVVSSYGVTEIGVQ